MDGIQCLRRMYLGLGPYFGRGFLSGHIDRGWSYVIKKQTNNEPHMVSKMLKLNCAHPLVNLLTQAVLSCDNILIFKVYGMVRTFHEHSVYLHFILQQIKHIDLNNYFRFAGGAHDDERLAFLLAFMFLFYVHYTDHSDCNFRVASETVDH